jgi:hypothetical protein
MSIGNTKLNRTMRTTARQGPILPFVLRSRECLALSLGIFVSIIILWANIRTPSLSATETIPGRISLSDETGTLKHNARVQIVERPYPVTTHTTVTTVTTVTTTVSTVNEATVVACPDDKACLPKARYLSPEQLMSRPFPPENPPNATIPKLIHQSWSSNELPAKFQQWSDTWRTNHPDWEWVLWTDADNQALVDKYFPWFKEAYGHVKGEIFRADAVRNLYMYAFGGYYL